MELAKLLIGVLIEFPSRVRPTAEDVQLDEHRRSFS
jgi:hypothetical protein